MDEVPIIGSLIGKKRLSRVIGTEFYLSCKFNCMDTAYTMTSTLVVSETEPVHARRGGDNS